jgi:glycosyltransferase involved in cell wall biosynthesis
VKPAGTRTPASSDGVLRVVSCSAMVAVKRLNLMAQGLGRLASEYPDLPIEWTHLGDGEERDRLEAAARGLPPNLRAIFPGSLANAQVLDFYRTHPVDVFLNTSQSEGIPVAMMEAQSFGIPIAAPDVGAVSEIVTGENGVLMSADPSPEEIARAVANLADCTHNTAKRAESLRTWLERYNAGTNYPRFVERLKVERLKVERLKVERLKAVDG